MYVLKKRKRKRNIDEKIALEVVALKQQCLGPTNGRKDPRFFIYKLLGTCVRGAKTNTSLYSENEKPKKPKPKPGVLIKIM